MAVTISEIGFEVGVRRGHADLMRRLKRVCEEHVPAGATPIRFVVTSTTASRHDCEVAIVEGLPPKRTQRDSLFAFHRRRLVNAGQFNVILLVPTGIGAELGGHAGDAGPLARLFGEIADTLILHPNVVNASDLNEMPQNALYVEGSVITRLLMGTIGLSLVRANRVLVVVDAHPDEMFVNAAVNSVSGARAAYGLACPEVICLDPGIKLIARYAKSGRAAGRVERLDGLLQLMSARHAAYDAVAISSVIDIPPEFHQDYFDSAGEMVNPWGGVEAMLTHALSLIYDVPTAHSPMFESREVANSDSGVVDPRMAAEAVSTTFLQCTLKGLQRSPRIVAGELLNGRDVLAARDIGCLVIPDGCLGLPTLAALEQGIPVIAVQENRNLMRNDLAELPWAPGQFHQVANYWEAAGVLTALRSGIDPATVRRPLAQTVVTTSRESSLISAEIAHKALRP